MDETGKGSRVTAEICRFLNFLTESSSHCAAMGGLVDRFVDNTGQKYDI